MSSELIEKLEPADREDINLYAPFYPPATREILPKALSLYKKGYLEGQRQIEGSDSITFVATWPVSRLPLDLTCCRIQFNGQAELSYQVTLQNSELVNYLIDTINAYKRSRTVDFPQPFYRKLLRMSEQTQS
jgi:hypothetical protein